MKIALEFTPHDVGTLLEAMQMSAETKEIVRTLIFKAYAEGEKAGKEYEKRVGIG